MPRSASHTRAEPRRARTGFSGRAKLLLGALVLVLAAAALHFSGFEWREAPAMLQRVNRPLAIVLMATLPIVGFPISAVYLAAGAIFGPWVGGLVVAGATLSHVLVTHLLARTVLRQRVEQLRRKWSKKVPKVPREENVTLVAMIVIVPALPYIARNVLLALSRVSLFHLVGIGVPLFVARSYVTIFLGDLGNDPSLRALLILGGVFCLKLGISAVLFQRLKRRSQPAG
jgi:uncharacterized membrane protein YdjX (TVP38/TMEM64 family)